MSASADNTTPPRLIPKGDADSASSSGSGPPMLESFPQLTPWDQRELTQVTSPQSQESPTSRGSEPAPALGSPSQFGLPRQEITTEECAKLWIAHLKERPDILGMYRPDQQLAFDSWRDENDIGGRSTGYGMVSYWLKWNNCADLLPQTPPTSMENIDKLVQKDEPIKRGVDAARNSLTSNFTNSLKVTEEKSASSINAYPSGERSGSVASTSPAELASIPKPVELSTSAKYLIGESSGSPLSTPGAGSSSRAPPLPPPTPPSRETSGAPVLLPTDPDALLQYTLEEFYRKYNNQNMGNLPKIIPKFQKRKSELWLQLSLKYQILPPESRKLWDGLACIDDPFSGDPYRFCSTNEEVKVLSTAWNTLQEELDVKDRSKLFDALLVAVNNGSNTEWGPSAQGILKVLTFFGVPEEYRPATWRICLGHWQPKDLEKRAVYNQYKVEFLTAVKNDEKDLYSQIVNDVDRTRQDMPFFNDAKNRDTMTAVLVVYAKLNPGVRYVQGMNEIVAIVLYVLYHDKRPEWQKHTEADTFWCFTNLLSEIQDNFIMEMDTCSSGVHAKLQKFQHLTLRYDRQVAKHLRSLECLPVLYALRWVTTLLSQVLTMTDVTRVWDSLIADPMRFDFMLQVCVALLQVDRDNLLAFQEMGPCLQNLQSIVSNRLSIGDVLREAYFYSAYERKISEFTQEQLDGPDIMEWANDVGAQANEKLSELAGEAAVQAKVAAKEAKKQMETWLEDTKETRAQAYEDGLAALGNFWSQAKSVGASALESARAAAEQAAIEAQKAAEAEAAKNGAQAGEQPPMQELSGKSSKSNGFPSPTI